MFFIFRSRMAPFNRYTDCWRCKGANHRREHCKNAPRLFCSYCGTDNISTEACPCNKVKTKNLEGVDFTKPRPANFKTVTRRATTRESPKRKQSPEPRPVRLLEPEPYTIVVDIDGYEYLARINTGSATTSIRPRIAIKRVSAIRTLGEGVEVSQRIAEVMLTIGSKSKIITCIEIPSQKTAIIIGRDTLSQFGTTITIGGYSSNYGNHERVSRGDVPGTSGLSANNMVRIRKQEEQPREIVTSTDQNDPETLEPNFHLETVENEDFDESGVTKSSEDVDIDRIDLNERVDLEFDDDDDDEEEAEQEHSFKRSKKHHQH